MGGLNNMGMTVETWRDVWSHGGSYYCVLTGACRVEAQRAQMSVLSSSKEAEKFDAIWHNTQKHIYETLCNENCKYCGTGHALWQCPTHRMKYRECGKAKHFKAVCKSLWEKLGNWYTKKVVDELHKEGEASLTKLEEHDQSFDMVGVKNINLNSYIYQNGIQQKPEGD